MRTHALLAVLSQRTSPLESLCASSVHRLHRGYSATARPFSTKLRERISKKKFHNERARFERICRGRRFAVCGFRKSLNHPKKQGNEKMSEAVRGINQISRSAQKLPLYPSTYIPDMYEPVQAYPT